MCICGGRSIRFSTTFGNHIAATCARAFGLVAAGCSSRSSVSPRASENLTSNRSLTSAAN